MCGPQVSAIRESNADLVRLLAGRPAPPVGRNRVNFASVGGRGALAPRLIFKAS
jgi:hypothetical protein